MIARYEIIIDAHELTGEEKEDVYRGSVHGEDLIECVNHLSSFYSSPSEHIVKLMLEPLEGYADENCYIIEME